LSAARRLKGTAASVEAAAELCRNVRRFIGRVRKS
jgi:hypothetical protein